MRYLRTSLIVVLSEFEGSSLFRKLQSSPIHRRNKIPDILCARYKCLPDKVCWTPSGRDFWKSRSLRSTRELRREVNKWYRGSLSRGLLSRSWWIRHWPQSSAAVQLNYASSATVLAIFISNSDYERLRTLVVKEHIMHAWSVFLLSLLIE